MKTQILKVRKKRVLRSRAERLAYARGYATGRKYKDNVIAFLIKELIEAKKPSGTTGI